LSPKRSHCSHQPHGASASPDEFSRLLTLGEADGPGNTEILIFGGEQILVAEV
jgi:hypothetical protein